MVIRFSLDVKKHYCIDNDTLEFGDSFSMTGHVSICVYMKDKQWKSLDTIFSREACVQTTKVLLLKCTAPQQDAKHEYSVVRKQELCGF